ncbi:MAG: isoprenylcysteine carboxylmethyltransferase family protein [Bacteroidales bacterium]
MDLKILMGSGRKIGAFSLPFFVIGIAINYFYPQFFWIDGSSGPLFWISILFLLLGVINWAWSVILILIKVPRKELITTGPFAVVKHPLYQGLVFLVIPWAGFLLNSWLGIVLGLVLYIAIRIFAPKEEQILSKIFGKDWDDYTKKVILPWI